MALDHKDRLAGLLEVSIADQGMEIGLALHPEEVGKGPGKSFVDQGIRFAVRHFGYTGDEFGLTGNIFATSLQCGFMKRLASQSVEGPAMRLR